MIKLKSVTYHTLLNRVLDKHIHILRLANLQLKMEQQYFNVTGIFLSFDIFDLAYNCKRNYSSIMVEVIITQF